MVQRHTGCNGPDQHVPRDPMREARTERLCESSVALSVFPACPLPAVAGLADLGPESILWSSVNTLRDQCFRRVAVLVPAVIVCLAPTACARLALAVLDSTDRLRHDGPLHGSSGPGACQRCRAFLCPVYHGDAGSLIPTKVVKYLNLVFPQPTAVKIELEPTALNLACERPALAGSHGQSPLPGVLGYRKRGVRRSAWTLDGLTADFRADGDSARHALLPGRENRPHLR